MTQEEKQILIKDLCARLPYGVKIQTWHGEVITADLNIFPFSLKDMIKGGADEQLNGIKPYLRSVRSLSEMEMNELQSLQKITVNGDIVMVSDTLESIDWMLTHHVDYRGLIEKGLAIMVTEENNPYETDNEKTLREKVEEAWEEGGITVMTIEGPLVYKANEIINQPVDGLLYDLNRDELTTYTIYADEISTNPRWVNDIATARVIRTLKNRLDYTERELEYLRSENRMLSARSKDARERLRNLTKKVKNDGVEKENADK